MPQQLSGDRFEITYEVMVTEVMVAKTITRHVCIDTSSRSKRELPEQIIKWLELLVVS